jgi:hypothetical protein
MNNKIKFIVDDIIKSHLSSNEFDFIFNRGCFHVISPEKRSKLQNYRGSKLNFKRRRDVVLEVL